MANASKTTDFSDLSYGKETRRTGDTVGLPHDEANNTVKEGEVVTVNGSGDIVRATNGDTVVGVLVSLPRAGDSGGPSDPAPVIQDEDATVRVRGVAKAVCADDVTAGNSLGVSSNNDGRFADSADGSVSEDDTANFIALSDSVEDDRADGSTVDYAEVLIR